MRVSLFVIVFFVSVFVVMTVSFASPTAEIVRDSSIGVSEDTIASIQFTPSNQYEFVKLDTAGNITASPSNLQASHLNENMVLTVGDISNPESNNAFTIKNTRNSAVLYSLSLEQRNEYVGAASDVTYYVQKNAGPVTVISANNTVEEFVLQPTDVLYISMRYDTTNQGTSNLNTNFIVESSTSSEVEATVLRPNLDSSVSPATQNTPLFQINETEPYYGGTNNQDFIQLVNNYDETVSVTVSLSNDNWAFSDGSMTKTYTLQPDESVQTVIDTKGNRDDTCNKTNTYSYTYSVSGATLTINDITNTVIICGGTGGGNSGGPGNGGGPPGQA